VAGATLGGKGERVQDSKQQTANDDYTPCGTTALECEAFLNGSLAEYWDDKGADVPVWAWMNLLAHGTARQIGECVLRPYRPRRGSRSWRVARSYLAYEVLDLTDLEFTLAELQRTVLIPLELEMAERDEVSDWTPRQWVDVVEDALRNNLWALDR
jgi:hypothetical protein